MTHNPFADPLLACLTAGALLAATVPQADAADPAASVAAAVDADYYDHGAPPAEKVALGRVLFFDRILSGNRNIACATCHQPRLGSGDDVPLSLGEGATGLGLQRRENADAPVLGRVPRNAQPLYNLGAREFTRLYHDGRVEADESNSWGSGFWSPAREQLPAGLDNPLAAQAMFPVLSPIEMAGHKGENEVATAVARDELAGPGGAWDLLARRLRDIDEYVDLFAAAFDDIKIASDISFVHAANAIAAFEATAFRSDDSPFDRYLATRDPGVLTAAEGRGMALFYGRAGCAGCHAGTFQTDQQFHAIAMPQIGPGKGDGTDHGYWRASGYGVRVEDEGRYRETRDPADRFRFRTPSLRNVTRTAPYGHAGAYASLEDVVRHHLSPVASLHAAQPAPLPPLTRLVEPVGRGSQLSFAPLNPARLDAFLARDRYVMSSDVLRGRIAAANELPPVALADDEVADLLAFLGALTGSPTFDSLVPTSVPSGLPVPD